MDRLQCRGGRIRTCDLPDPLARDAMTGLRYTPNGAESGGFDSPRGNGLILRGGWFKSPVVVDGMYKQKKPVQRTGFYVGVAGFEPATSSSQTRRDDRATLHPEL